jgi:hypothetical protein
VEGAARSATAAYAAMPIVETTPNGVRRSRLEEAYAQLDQLGDDIVISRIATQIRCPYFSVPIAQICDRILKCSAQTTAAKSSRGKLSSHPFLALDRVGHSMALM